MCFFTAGALRALKKPVRKSGCISSERCCQEVSLLLGRYLRAHENFWRGTDHWKGMNFFHQTAPLEDKTAFPIPLAFPLPLTPAALREKYSDCLLLECQIMKLLGSYLTQSFVAPGAMPECVFGTCFEFRMIEMIPIWDGDSSAYNWNVFWNHQMFGGIWNSWVKILHYFFFQSWFSLFNKYLIFFFPACLTLV